MGVAWVLASTSSSPHVSTASATVTVPLALSSQDGTSSADASSAGLATTTFEVEVPDVQGKTVRVAGALLAASGLTVQTRVSDVNGFSVVREGVLKQWPAPGARVQNGSVVTLTYQPLLGLASGGRPFVVVVDAGHQAKPDPALEPQGPGSKLMKPKVSAGVVGVVTGGRESSESLAIALHLRDVLLAVGADVVMVRTSESVDISNSERARIGNEAHADLVVRVHQSFSPDGSLAGVTAFYPSGNAWVAGIEAASKDAAQRLEDAVVQAVGAKRRGIVGRADLSGFNYSQVPAVMIECGYLSNRVEDAQMSSEVYRTKLSNGIAAGVMGYLRSL